MAGQLPRDRRHRAHETRTHWAGATACIDRPDRPAGGREWKAPSQERRRRAARRAGRSCCPAGSRHGPERPCRRRASGLFRARRSAFPCPVRRRSARHGTASTSDRTGDRNSCPACRNPQVRQLRNRPNAAPPALRSSRRISRRARRWSSVRRARDPRRCVPRYRPSHRTCGRSVNRCPTDAACAARGRSFPPAPT